MKGAEEVQSRHDRCGWMLMLLGLWLSVAVLIDSLAGISSTEYSEEGAVVILTATENEMPWNAMCRAYAGRTTSFELGWPPK